MNQVVILCQLVTHPNESIMFYGSCARPPKRFPQISTVPIVPNYFRSSLALSTPQTIFLRTLPNKLAQAEPPFRPPHNGAMASQHTLNKDLSVAHTPSTPATTVDLYLPRGSSSACEHDLKTLIPQPTLAAPSISTLDADVSPPNALDMWLQHVSTACPNQLPSTVSPPVTDPSISQTISQSLPHTYLSDLFPNQNDPDISFHLDDPQINHSSLPPADPPSISHPTLLIPSDAHYHQLQTENFPANDHFSYHPDCSEAPTTPSALPNTSHAHAQLKLLHSRTPSSQPLTNSESPPPISPTPLPSAPRFHDDDCSQHPYHHCTCQISTVQAPCFNLSPDHLASYSHDGLSAVERAKRSAEQFTMAQLSSRKRKTPPGDINPSSDDLVDDCSDSVQKESKRKYQKRLRKNRDSAFVSRIRRREYTRILESTLTAVEREKDAAVAAYKEMKRKFDVVAAELAGMKAAVTHNLSSRVRDPIVNVVTHSTNQLYKHFGFDSSLTKRESPHFKTGLHRPFVQTQPSLWRPPQNLPHAPDNLTDNCVLRIRPGHSEEQQPQQQIQQQVQQQQNVGFDSRPGPYVRRMYMVALIIGVLLPKSPPHRMIPSRMFGRFSETNSPHAETSGHIWAANVAAKNHWNGAGHNNDEIDVAMEHHSMPRHDRNGDCGDFAICADLSNGSADRVIENVRHDATLTWGAVQTSEVLQRLREYLVNLSEHDVGQIDIVAHHEEIQYNRNKAVAIIAAIARIEGVFESHSLFSNSTMDDSVDVDHVVHLFEQLDVHTEF